MRKIQKNFMAMLLMFVMLLGSTLNVSAVTSVELDNVEGKHQVSGVDAVGSFSVILKDANDEIEVYKIAEMLWDEGQNTYSEIAWVTPVAEWQAASATYNAATYATPKALGKASSEMQETFIADIIADTDLMDALSASYQVAESAITKVTPAPEELTAKTSYLVSDQAFGLYLVKAANPSGGKTYSPVTVSLVPDQEGPVGHWYLQENIEANLKSSSVTVKKTINGKAADTVQIGETVEFEVISSFPEYTREEGTKPYTFAVDDVMSEAFALDSSTVKIQYQTSSEGEWLDLDSQYYSAIIASPAATKDSVGAAVYRCPTAGHDDFNIYSIYDGTTFTYYYYKGGAYHVLGTADNNSSSTLSTMRQNYENITGDTVNHTIQYYADAVKSIFNVTFNYSQMKADSFSAFRLRIAYQAKVTEKAEVGVETNTNTMNMYYEEDSAGTVATATSTAKAYTYAVNVVKKDGSAATDTYLAGAIFSLYREGDTYCGYSASDETDHAAFTWLSNVDGKAQTYADLAAMEAALASDTYYVLTQEVASCASDTNPHKHMVVFDKKESSITSVATAAGVTVKGLDPARYILQEDTPPTGYNALKEDLLFAIRELDENTASTQYGGSYAAFVDDKDNTVTTGIYPIEVLNFKGITLPDTGGMGTTIFTIAGIALMVIAMILLLKKRRNRRLVKTALALLLAVSMAAGTGISAAAVVTIRLDSLQSGAQVTGDDAKGNFSVIVRDENDTLEIYKIAEMKWDDANNTYSDVAWVFAVQNWAGSHATYSADQYSTPAKLGAADIGDQTAFLSAIRDNTTLLSNLTTGGNKVDAAGIVKQSTESGETAYTVANQSFGIYLILAKNDTLGKEYQPLTVNVLPTQEGPVGNWYLQGNISATLKYENLNVDKKINGGDYDLVRKDEVVDFTIEAEVPEYPEKAAEDTSGYCYGLTDILSPAYTFKGNANTGFTFEYYDGTSWKSLTEGVTTKYVEQSGGSGSSAWTLKAYGWEGSDDSDPFIFVNVNSYMGMYKWYFMQDGCFKYHGDFGLTATSRYPSDAQIKVHYEYLRDNFDGMYFGEDYTPEFASKNIVQKPFEGALISLGFDYVTLKNLNAQRVRVSYQATVNDKAAVGADTNTNIAYLNYQKDASGAMTRAKDTVTAWTYGLKVVKQDGETSDYLAGAKFSLYREADTYYGTADASTAVSDYEKYTWYSNADGAMEAPTGTTASNGEEQLTTLDKVADVTGADNFYQAVKITAAEAVSCTHEGATEIGGAGIEHYHIIVHKLVKSGITSVATADGVKITGLDPAVYILRETQAPSGYNLLSEAIRFEIKSISEIEANADGGSYKAFVGDDDQKYADGIYPVSVLNFKGIQLPETGGIGTLIFTVCGIALMILAIILILVKRRKKEAEAKNKNAK